MKLCKTLILCSDKCNFDIVTNKMHSHKTFIYIVCMLKITWYSINHTADWLTDLNAWVAIHIPNFLCTGFVSHHPPTASVSQLEWQRAPVTQGTEGGQFCLFSFRGLDRSVKQTLLGAHTTEVAPRITWLHRPCVSRQNIWNGSTF